MSRQEIEIKARVQNPQALTEKLNSLGVQLSPPSRQEDSWFVNFDGPYEESRLKENFLRLRKQDGVWIFTAKQTQHNDLDTIEYQTRIEDPIQMEKALELIGYHKVVEVVKDRQTARFQGCEICLDSIQGIGDYIEIEKITENQDGLTVQEDLFQMLTPLGITRADLETRGYDTLVYLHEQDRLN